MGQQTKTNHSRSIKFEQCDLPTVRPTSEFALFLGGRGIFSKIDHVLGHKSNLNKIPCIKIIPQNKTANQ